MALHPPLRLFASVLLLTIYARAQIRTISTPAVTLRLSEHSGDVVGLHWKGPNLEPSNHRN